MCEQKSRKICACIKKVQSWSSHSYTQCLKETRHFIVAKTTTFKIPHCDESHSIPSASRKPCLGMWDLGRPVFSKTIQSSAPQVRIWEFASRLLKNATQQTHLLGDRVHAANMSLLSWLSGINQAFFNSFWSVSPKQGLGKTAYILIELAFSTEIFFFFFL